MGRGLGAIRRYPDAVLRVGTVPYLVGRPLDLGLVDEPGIDLVYDVPARLVDGLRDGSLDVALVSSIELFRRPGYAYLADLAVSGRGYVSSVQVFLRRPAPEVRTIALDPASRTAAALTRVVWPHIGGAPEFIEVETGTDPRGIGADAWLRIGDAALREVSEENAAPVLNPSDVWARMTGLPFIFAPWIVRERADIAPFTGAFARAAQRGERALAELARSEAEATGLDEELLGRYLADECLFVPGKELGPALFAYRDRAAALGLADGALAPSAIPLG